MRRWHYAAVLVVALLVSACGSSGEDVEDGTPASGVEPEVGDIELIDPATLDPESLSREEATVEVREEPLPLDTDQMDAIAERTVVLVDRFGNDGAFDALLLAIGRGYSPSAIADGIESGTLDVLGFIAGVEPSLPASTLLELPPAVQGLRTASSADAEGLLPVQELRRTADAFQQVSERALEPWEAPENATGEGVAMLMFVQRLAEAGLSGDQIVNAIVLGYGGISTRYLQIGMGAAIASCRVVIIGGVAEPIGSDRCKGFGERDLKLRDRYVDAGLDYPSCDERTIEGIYDACAFENDSTDADDGATDGGRPVVEIDDASYIVVATTGQLETYNLEVMGGTLEVSADDEDLVVTGNLDVLTSLWSDGAGGMRCGAQYSVVVGAVEPIAEEMSTRLYATDFGDWEFVGDCEPDQWTRAAESRFDYYNESGVAQLIVVVDEGTLVGSVGNGGGIADNLQRAG